jgi:hypothetical protein
VVRAPARRRPGLGQAARLAGPARDQLPARRPGRGPPDHPALVRRLQAYPSRSKDPDTVDYSTGSVGIGATAPIWGALSRRYVDSHLGGAGSGRQYSLVGDAELDEGAVWEAVLDPMVAELGEVVWIIDLNRQSLDRVVPNIGATRLQGMFAAAGWQVLTVKYGRLLEELFARSGGAALRARIDAMPNPEYQRLLRCTRRAAARAAARRRRRAGRAARVPGRRRPARGVPQPGRPRPARAARGVRPRSTTPARRWCSPTP